MIKLIFKGVGRLALAGAILLSGLMVCIHVPQVTDMLSRMTSHASIAGVDVDTIAKASVASRDFSMGLIGIEGLKSTFATLGIPTDALDTSMLTHLQDCTWVFQLVTNVFLALAAAGLVFAILAAVFGGRNGLARMLRHSAILALVILAVFAIWVTIGFDSFFTWMHSLFFANGTWTFDANSFLISMYPENFWLGMGVVWALTTIIVAIVVIGVSQIVKKH